MPLMTVKQVAKELGICRQSVYNLRDRGELHFVRIPLGGPAGRKPVRVDSSEVDALKLRMSVALSDEPKPHAGEHPSKPAAASPTGRWKPPPQRPPADQKAGSRAPTRRTSRRRPMHFE